MQILSIGASALMAAAASTSISVMILWKAESPKPDNEPSVSGIHHSATATMTDSVSGIHDVFMSQGLKKTKDTVPGENDGDDPSMEKDGYEATPA